MKRPTQRNVAGYFRRGVLGVSLGFMGALGFVAATRDAPEQDRSRRGASLTTPRRIAITIDDVPAVGSGGAPLCSSDSLSRWTTRFVDRIDSLGIPVAAFVVTQQVCPALAEGPLRKAIMRWRDAGALIGSHTASHPDYHRTTLPEYLKDVDRAGDYLRRVLDNPSTMYFRHPYLHTGQTASARDSLAQALKARGYVEAPVTVDNQEWVYAAAYDRARTRRDQAGQKRITAAFLEHIDETIDFSERAAQVVVGRPMAHVLLLHANALVYENLPDLVHIIRGRGYEFVSLDSALLDSVYFRGNPYAGPQGLSWVLRWATPQQRAALQEPREAEWVRAYLQQR